MYLLWRIIDQACVVAPVLANDASTVQLNPLSE